MIKYFVIYNTITGAIVFQSTLRDEEEPLSGGLIVEVPDGKTLIAINPQTKEPIFEDVPATPDLDKMESQLFYTAVMTDTLIEEE